jgi:hypothetical protein
MTKPETREKRERERDRQNSLLGSFLGNPSLPDIILSSVLAFLGYQRFGAGGALAAPACYQIAKNSGSEIVGTCSLGTLAVIGLWNPSGIPQALKERLGDEIIVYENIREFLKRQFPGV